MLKEFKVLIIEDEILIARSLFADLQDLGINVLEPISNGEKAVEVALQEIPDLILMDIRLAGEMDGIETASRIQKTKNIAVIFMSGYATEVIKEKAKAVNNIGFFEKPVNIDQLKTVIAELNVH
jgi:two-component system, response regulator PdtaR